MKMIEFTQLKELDTMIDELGGIDECANCKEKTAILSQLMKKSDALMIAKVDALADQTRNSSNEVSSSINKARECMHYNFGKLQEETEKAAMRNAVLEQQVSTLANTLVEVKDMLKKCPGECSQISYSMITSKSSFIPLSCSFFVNISPNK